MVIHGPCWLIVLALLFDSQFWKDRFFFFFLNNHKNVSHFYCGIIYWTTVNETNQVILSRLAHSEPVQVKTRVKTLLKSYFNYS